MVFVVNTGLKMGVGKIAAQVRNSVMCLPLHQWYYYLVRSS